MPSIPITAVVPLTAVVRLLSVILPSTAYAISHHRILSPEKTIMPLLPD